MSVASQPTCLFGLEKKPTFEPKLTSAEAYLGFLGLYFTKKLHLPHTKFPQVGQLVWTNKDR